MTLVFALIALNCLIPPREWVSGPTRDPGRGFLFLNVDKAGVTSTGWSQCKIDMGFLITSSLFLFFSGLVLARGPEQLRELAKEADNEFVPFSERVAKKTDVRG